MKNNNDDIRIERPIRMITGIGVDLIEIKRVISACENEHFMRRIYTDREILIIEQDRRKAADNFAVKEAVAKMLGTGFVGFFPIDIEVLRDEKGKPYVNLTGKAARLAGQQGVTKIHVSITNTKVYSNAFVVGESLLHAINEADGSQNEVCRKFKGNETD